MLLTPGPSSVFPPFHNSEEMLSKCPAWVKHKACVTGPGCSLVAVLIFTWPTFSFLREKNMLLLLFFFLKSKKWSKPDHRWDSESSSCHLLHGDLSWKKSFVLAQVWGGQVLYKALPQDSCDPTNYQDMSLSRFTAVSVIGKKNVSEVILHEILIDTL